jgi:hypothetical protein
MTTPNIGHPDGQAYAVWRSNAIAKGSNVALAAGVPIVTQTFLTNYSSLLLLVNCGNSAGMTVIVAFNDAPGDTPTFSFSWVLPKNGSLERILPALGNNVKITLQTSQAGGTTTSYRIAPSNLTANYPAAPSQVAWNAAFPSQLVAAGGTVTITTTRVDDGELNVILTPLDNSGSITAKIQLAGEDGVVTTTIWQGTLATVALAATNLRILVGGQPMLIVLTNTDVVNPHSLDWYFSLTPRT